MSNPSQEEHQHRSPFQGFLPFFWLALACLGGILLADLAHSPAWIWLAGMAVSVLALILTWRLPRSLVLTYHLRKWTRFDQRLPGALLAAVFFLGAWRYADLRQEVTPWHAAYYNDRGSVQLIGTVVKPPDYRDNITNLEVQVEQLLLFGEGQQPIHPEDITGRVLVQVQPGSEWAYGYRVMVTGPLSTPPEHADFSFQVYLARKGVQSLMTNPRIDRVEFNQGDPIKTLIYTLHARAYAALQSLFPSPESDLLAGILLGRDQGLSPGLQDAFRRTGTTHIIAISGFNVAILAGLFSGVFTRLLGRKWGALTAIAAISAYTIFVGGDAAVTRAAIMGALGVLGGMFGRRQNGLNSLGLAVLLMAVVNPSIPWDIGFQLSVAATLGLVLYAQPLEERFVQLAARKMPDESAQKLVGPVSEFVLFTLAAQVMTLPIMIYHFGGVSWITLVANPLILPPQAPLMVLGGLTLLAGLVLPGLGQAMTVISLPFVRYTIRMVTWLARLPGSDLILPDFHVLWLVIFYALLFLCTLFPAQQRQSILKKIASPQVGVLILAGLVVFVWNQVLTAPDGLLHLTLLDGQGTVLVQSPSGQSVLIGGGPSPSALNQALGQMLPAGHRQLDAVIVGSTAREDLLGLTSAVKRYPIHTVLWGVNPEANQSCRTVYALLAEKGTPRHTMQTGQTLDLGDGLHIQILWTGERGAVLWLTWESFSALIPTGRVDEHWHDPPAPPKVVSLPKSSPSQALPLGQITLWGPAVILLPQDPTNLPLDGVHPVLELLKDYPLLSTLDHGWVRVSTDGEQMWVRAEK
jgi:competence protein ComEC